MNTRSPGNSWQFLHICDLQPGAPRSFRFTAKHRENWQTALGLLIMATLIPSVHAG